jgi:hypothetical protein
MSVKALPFRVGVQEQKDVTDVLFWPLGGPLLDGANEKVCI